MGKKIAIDTYYYDSENLAKTVGVVFNNWSDSKPSEVIVSWYSGEIKKYVSGEFYKRELPCIQKLLSLIPDLNTYDAIILDGYAKLPYESSSPEGLGVRLEEYLCSLGYCPGIIGVAKTKFSGGKENLITKVFRGRAKNPLYITTTGKQYTDAFAGSCIQSMHGGNRIPTLLKLLDKETKTREK